MGLKRTIDLFLFITILSSTGVLSRITTTYSRSCSMGCSSCSGGYCYSCMSGYYRSGGDCYSCGSRCASCSRYSACDRCESGYYVDYRGSCNSCFSGCGSCSDSISCSLCSTGHYPIKNSLNAITSCGSCISNCNTCNGPSGCTTCSLFYKYENEKCVTDGNQVIIYLGICAFALCFIAIVIVSCCICYQRSESKRRRANQFFDNNYNSVNTDISSYNQTSYTTPMNVQPGYIAPQMNHQPYIPNGYQNYTGNQAKGY